MGKAALLLVLGLTLSLTSIYATRFETSRQTTIVQTNYEEGVLARELAHSGFNVVVSRVTKDFAGYRTAAQEASVDGGHILYSAEGATEGPVTIHAYGTMGKASHYINATIERTSSGWLDAITADGPVASVTARGSSFLISGIDTVADPDEATAGNVDGHAIRTTVASAGTKFDDAIDDAQAVGIAGEGDFITGAPHINLNDLETALRSYDQAIVLDGNQRVNGNDTYGTRDQPVVVIVNGDMDVRGSVTGYGALVVTGDLIMRGSVQWEGLVFVSTAGGDHQLKGTVDIYGALVMRSLTSDGESGGEEDAGLLGGHFDLDVFSGADSLAYHEHQYDDKHDRAAVNLLQTGCVTSGGLCWDQLVQATDAQRVRVEFNNPAAVDGTYLFRTTGEQVDGTIANGFSREALVADMQELTVTPATACGIDGATPGTVWADEVDRGGVFTLRVYDVDDVATGGSEQLLMETSIYRHSVQSDCEEEDGQLVNEQVEVAPITFYINGNVGIHLSSDAISRIADIIPQVEPTPSEIRITSIRENAERQVGLSM